MFFECIYSIPLNKAYLKHKLPTLFFMFNLMLIHHVNFLLITISSFLIINPLLCSNLFHLKILPLFSQMKDAQVNYLFLSLNTLIHFFLHTWQHNISRQFLILLIKLLLNSLNLKLIKEYKNLIF